MKKLTVKELMGMRSKNMENRHVVVELEEGQLEGELLPITAMLEMQDEYDTNSQVGQFEFALELIYMTFPIFRDKSLQEQCGCHEPHEVVSQILTPMDLQKVVKQINKIYGVENPVEQVKK